MRFTWSRNAWFDPDNEGLSSSQNATVSAFVTDTVCIYLAYWHDIILMGYVWLPCPGLLDEVLFKNGRTVPLRCGLVIFGERLD